MCVRGRGGAGFLKLLPQLWPYKYRLLGFNINEQMQPHITGPAVYVDTTFRVQT